MAKEMTQVPLCNETITLHIKKIAVMDIFVHFLVWTYAFVSLG